MEKSSKRGKIPQQDWPSIIARYEAGETLASIARTYDCSPPAISYIVSRTRARSTAAEAAAYTAPAAAEPQLLKGPTLEAPVDSIPARDSLHGRMEAGATKSLDVPAAEPRVIERPAGTPQPQSNERGLFPDEAPKTPISRTNSASSEGNGPMPRFGQVQRGAPSPAGIGNAPRPQAHAGPPQNGDSRRTLHLSLSQGNGGPHGPDSQPLNASNIGNSGSADRFAPRPAGAQPAFGQTPRQSSGGHDPSPGSPPVPAYGGTAPMHPPGEPARTKDGAAFIDRALRERVDGDIAAFLAAFDAALDHDTSQTRTELREATDRLLRAGARTRIELERLEARAPLPTRDKIGQSAPLFRHR
jgi:hypothetical protein